MAELRWVDVAAAGGIREWVDAELARPRGRPRAREARHQGLLSDGDAAAGQGPAPACRPRRATRDADGAAVHRVAAPGGPDPRQDLLRRDRAALVAAGRADEPVDHERAVPAACRAAVGARGEARCALHALRRRPRVLVARRRQGRDRELDEGGQRDRPRRGLHGPREEDPRDALGRAPAAARPRRQHRAGGSPARARAAPDGAKPARGDQEPRARQARQGRDPRTPEGAVRVRHDHASRARLGAHGARRSFDRSTWRFVMSDWTVHLEFEEGNSSKFWRARVEGKTLFVNYGKIGANGQTQVKDFASEAAAAGEYDKLVREKRKKGYVDANGGGAVAEPDDDDVDDDGDAGGDDEDERPAV